MKSYRGGNAVIEGGLLQVFGGHFFVDYFGFFSLFWLILLRFNYSCSILVALTCLFISFALKLSEVNFNALIDLLTKAVLRLVVKCFEV